MLGEKLGNNRSELTMQVAVAGKGLTFTLPPLALLLALIVGLGCYHIAETKATRAQKRQIETVTRLEERNQELERQLSEEKKESKRMQALAESRSEELWSELASRDRELKKIWRIVGVQPSTPSRRGLSRRYTQLASRGASSRATSTAVKVKYQDLLSEFRESEEDLRSLADAAKEYRRAKVEAYRAKLASITPSIRPCRGELTSGFGNRVHPVYGTGRFHGGCDFTAPYGTEIYCTAGGTVVHADWLGGYGRTVEIDHGRGVKTLYAHCSELKVKKGQKVEKGQLIGLVGTSGLSSGPHCHYEVRKNNKQIDPKPYLSAPPTEKEGSRPIAKL